MNTHNNAHKAVAGLPTQEDLGAALNGYCSALYLYNAVYGETVADRNNGLLTDADIPGDDDAAYIAALKDAIQSVIDDPVGAIHANTQAADSAFAQFATQVLNNLIPYDVLPGDTVEAKDASMAVLRDLVYDLCEKMDIDPAQFILD